MTAAGDIATGVLDAASQAEAIAQIRRQGHWPIEAVDNRAAGWRQYLPQGVLPPARAGRRTIAMATQELAALLQAGLTLDRAIEIIIELEETRRLRAPLRIVLAALRNGLTLADALTEARVFDRSYITMVRAGELGGNLETTLRRLADYLARATATRDTVLSALVYPAMLLLTAGLSVVIILVLVLPEFAPLFAQAGKSLPFATRMVMGAGDFLANWWWAILAVAAAGLYYYRRALRQAPFRLRHDKALLRLPVLGDLLLRMEIERFCRMLGTLLGGGVALPQALGVVRDTLANRAVADAVGETAARLKEGEELAGRLRQTGVFPPVALDFIRVGEETGRLDEMLLKQAEFYEREIKNRLDRLMALLTPALTVVMGMLVAGLIASILVAILSINELAM